MTPFGIVVTTSGTTVALIGFALWLARNLIQERLQGAIKYEYDTKLETFKSDLRNELARLQKDLDLLKQKELSGHQKKLDTYYALKAEDHGRQPVSEGVPLRP